MLRRIPYVLLVLAIRVWGSLIAELATEGPHSVDKRVDLPGISFITYNVGHSPGTCESWWVDDWAGEILGDCDSSRNKRVFIGRSLKIERNYTINEGRSHVRTRFLVLEGTRISDIYSCFHFAIFSPTEEEIAGGIFGIDGFWLRSDYYSIEAFADGKTLEDFPNIVIEFKTFDTIPTSTSSVPSHSRHSLTGLPLNTLQQSPPGSPVVSYQDSESWVGPNTRYDSPLDAPRDTVLDPPVNTQWQMCGTAGTILRWFGCFGFQHQARPDSHVGI